MDETIVPEFNSWLEELVSSNGSDLHVKVGSPPMVRLTHGLVRLERDPLSPIETQAIADGVIPEDRKALFKERGEVDFAYSVANVGRFRANVFRQRGSVSVWLNVVCATYSRPASRSSGRAMWSTSSTSMYTWSTLALPRVVPGR